MNTRPSPLSFASMLVRAQRRHQANHATAAFAKHDSVTPSDVPALDVAARRMTNASPSLARASR